MKILNIDDDYQQVIEETARIIKNGGLVIFPSDTVYILAVDPTNKKAVDKLFEFKNRQTGKAISVAVLDQKMAQYYVELSESALNIYKNILPGPFTVVSKSKHKTRKEIEAENGTLGIRIPDNKYINDLILKLQIPVTATSANLSGKTPHYSIKSFLNSLSEKKKEMIDLIVDGGKLPKNKPSTVIDTTEPEIKILRRGDLITGGGQTLISKSEKETENIAKFLFKKIAEKKHEKPVVLALSGDLGCGKTVFSRSIGKYIGIKDKITSPTFVIYNEYPVRFDKFQKFLHFDLYRLSEQYEFDELSFFDLFEPNTITCIEWPENMGEENFQKLKEMTDLTVVNFQYVDPTTREINF